MVVVLLQVPGCEFCFQYAPVCIISVSCLPHFHYSSHEIASFLLFQCLPHLQLRPKKLFKGYSCFMQDGRLRMISLTRSLNVLLTFKKCYTCDTVNRCHLNTARNCTQSFAESCFPDVADDNRPAMRSEIQKTETKFVQCSSGTRELALIESASLHRRR